MRAHNAGAAFSLLASASGWQRWLFTAIGVAAAALIVWQLNANRGQRLISLAMALMAILLVTQFNSYYQALIILSSVLLSTAGVLLGLLTTGQTFSVILTGIGIVALSGIIVNNNIVLIDTFNYLKAKHGDWTLEEIIVQTGVQRLRPVFLTTFTTGFGLLPLAMHVSVDLINA